MDWNDFVYVKNLVDYDKPIEMEYFFGKEAKKMFLACKAIMRNSMFKYDGCTDEESRKNWELERDRQFNIAYGVAMRHGLYVEWLGNNSVCRLPDQFMVYKKGKYINGEYHKGKRLAVICVQ